MIFSFYEFFAGAGMAREGLGSAWTCLFANDCDAEKRLSYVANWSAEHWDDRDVRSVETTDLPGFADLAWASFPCQDLSQAGTKQGIGEAGNEAATRSGAVWPFLNLVRGLAEEGRHPVLLALENVVGLLNANGGADFRAICAALSKIGYRFGALIADACHFVPQSRPRVFIIAIRRDVPLPFGLHGELPCEPWHTQTLLRARAALAPSDVSNWVWWTPGDPPPLAEQAQLAQIIDLTDDANWNTDESTTRLIGMMSDAQQLRLAQAKIAGRPMIGSLYLRMRPDGQGRNIQRAEIAFGSTLGCLRTPKGGASRPRIIVVDGERVRTRLLSVREAALLMGLDDDFILPATYNECFRLIGDGVVPPVVRFLADGLLEPLAAHSKAFLTWPADHKASA